MFFYPNSDLQAQGLSCLGILRQGICSTWDQKSLGEFEGFSGCSWMFVVDISWYITIYLKRVWFIIFFSIEWHDAGFSADELMIEFLCVNVGARRSHRAEQKYPCGFNHHARKWAFSTFHFLVLLPVWCTVCWHQPGSSGHHETASTQLSLPSSQASSVGLDESPHGDVRPNPSHFRRRLFVVVDSCGGAVVHSSTQERKADRS